jgi:hypothetical protein
MLGPLRVSHALPVICEGVVRPIGGLTAWVADCQIVHEIQINPQKTKKHQNEDSSHQPIENKWA